MQLWPRRQVALRRPRRDVVGRKAQPSTPSSPPHHLPLAHTHHGRSRELLDVPSLSSPRRNDPLPVPMLSSRGLAFLAPCACRRAPPSSSLALRSALSYYAPVRDSDPATPRSSIWGLLPPPSSLHSSSYPPPSASEPLPRSSSKGKERGKEEKSDGVFARFLRGRGRSSNVQSETSRRNMEAERALEAMSRAAGSKGHAPFGSAGLKLRCTTLNSKGDVTNTAGDFAKGELCERFGIQPRDLRKLDSGVPTVVPTILVRRAAILFTILHLRVVITANEVSLFDSAGSEDSWLKGAFIWNLEYVLRTSTKAAHGLPYEFRALEACLNSVTYALETEMINIRKLVVDLLDGLEDHIERDKLRLLLQYSRKLSAFQKRATLVQECLEEVLENDDDLAAMYLTSKLEGRPRDASEHEEIELLLESFSKQCEEIVSEVDNLAANVRHTEDIVELILDANRNSLLGLDLKVSICTLGLTSGALVAGLFGMLSTRLEDHPYAFPLISISAFTFAAIITVIGLRRLRIMRKIGLGGMDRNEPTMRLGSLAWREDKRASRSRRHHM